MRAWLDRSSRAPFSVVSSAGGFLCLRRRSLTTDGRDVLSPDKGRTVSPTRAFMIDDGRHLRVIELGAERRHHGRIGNAADRLAVESVKDRPQVLGRIPGRYRGAPGERGENTGEALAGELMARRTVVPEDLGTLGLPRRRGRRGAGGRVRRRHGRRGR